MFLRNVLRATLIVSIGCLSATANAQSTASCENQTNAIATHCPPEVGHGVKKTCMGCAMTLANCWEHCDDSSLCTFDGLDTAYPPKDSTGSGAYTCPKAWEDYYKKKPKVVSLDEALDALATELY